MCTATTDWEETLFWIAWFTPAWQAQHVPSTCWATATVTSLAVPSVGGKNEGSKNDHASLGGTSLLDCVFYAQVAGAACAKYLLGDSDGHVVALAFGGKVEGSKGDQDNLGGNFWIAWFTPTWQAQHVPSTCWATATVTFFVALAGGGKVEGSKSDQAIVGDGGWAEMSAAGVDRLRWHYVNGGQALGGD